MISCVLIDLAGVVYVGDEQVPGADAALAKLSQAGLPVRFLTNTTRSPKQAILARLERMGLAVAAEDVFTPVDAARAWLSRNRARPLLLVHPDLAGALAGFEDEPNEAVVIGDAGEAFDYRAMNAAFRALLGGAGLIALAENRYFRDNDGELSLDAGPFVDALEFASGREAILMGKPAPDFFAAALAQMGCAGADAVMIGDDVESDVSGALTAGISKALLVRTGKYLAGIEATADPPPTAVVDDLPAAVEWILAARGR